MASLTPLNGTLGIERAAHFLRRTTFGPTRAEIESFASKTVTQAVNDIMQPLPVPDPPVDPKTGTDWLPKPDETNSGDDSLFEYFKGWFLEQMRTSGANITERMTYFLHVFLPADHTLIANSTSLYYQNALYRQFALGNLKKLMEKVCVDNAMLVYIDNTLNDKDKPNENFARELQELYTIGKGPQIGPEDYTNYTETDVKEAARVLTGIKHNFDFDTIDPDTNLPRGKVTLNASLQASRHDPGTKQFTDKYNNTVIAPKLEYMIDGQATEEGFFDEINQLIEMIYAQEETARFFCRRLYRFFVYYEITEEIENDIIAPLAQTLINNDYEIKPVLEQLLSSEHFFDVNNSSTANNNFGALIKSPVDLVVGTFRFFKINLPTDSMELYHYAYSQGISRMLDDMGQHFYKPIDVAGYPPYHQVPAYNRNWISPNNLAERYHLANLIIDGKTSDETGDVLYKLDTVAFVEDSSNISDPSDANVLVRELVDYMFPQPIPDDRFSYFLNSVLLDSLTPEMWTDEWNDYQNSGDSNGVRAQLDRLIIKMIQSPEYQLM